MRLCSEKHSRKEEALERLRNGEDWDAVADKYAEHLNSKSEWILQLSRRSQTPKVLT
jgi:hypothetical protein